MIPEIKLAYYQKKDWEKLMNSIVDRESMHDTWEEWHHEYTRSKTMMKNRGLIVHEMIININELNKYCKEKNLKNDGNARSQYVSQLPLHEKNN